jgi:hypothetical protein
MCRLQWLRSFNLRLTGFHLHDILLLKSVQVASAWVWGQSFYLLGSLPSKAIRVASAWVWCQRFHLLDALPSKAVQAASAWVWGHEFPSPRYLTIKGCFGGICLGLGSEFLVPRCLAIKGYSGSICLGLGSECPSPRCLAQQPRLFGWHLPGFVNQNFPSPTDALPTKADQASTRDCASEFSISVLDELPSMASELDLSRGFSEARMCRLPHHHYL